MRVVGVLILLAGCAASLDRERALGLHRECDADAECAAGQKCINWGPSSACEIPCGGRVGRDASYDVDLDCPRGFECFSDEDIADGPTDICLAVPSDDRKPESERK